MCTREDRDVLVTFVLFTMSGCSFSLSKQDLFNLALVLVGSKL